MLLPMQKLTGVAEFDFRVLNFRVFQEIPWRHPGRRDVFSCLIFSPLVGFLHVFSCFLMLSAHMEVMFRHV